MGRNFFIVVLFAVLAALVSGKDNVTNITTTAVPTTTDQPNVTTTALPITTTPVIPSTTGSPSPTVLPDLKQGHWNVTKDGKTCILAAMAVEFSIVYPKTNNTNGTAIVTLPSKANVTSNSTCTGFNETQVLELSFGNNSWRVVFANTSNSYFIKKISLRYVIDKNFPNATISGGQLVELDNLHIFPTTKGRSYMCSSSSKVDLKKNVTISISELRLEAYRTGNSTEFSSAEECEADDSSDTVIIAVGCALAALVIFVLIAYLVGRRRSRQKGYQSV